MASHEDAIDQLCAITATETTMGRRSIEQVLRSTDWNVEQAADLIFSNPEALRQSEAIPQPRVERQAEEPRPRRAEPRRRARAPPVARVGILNTLTWPIRFVLRIVSGLWYLLVRNVLPLGLLPYMPRFLLPPSGTSTNYPSIPLAPRRSFAETLRQECPDGYMPDFWRQDDEERPTYKEFLNHLKTERKVGCVVLCCADHEDDLIFKRNVLTNEEFVKCLRENEILIWAADIREKEGYQISQTLQATTYPSISFFSLMPVGSSGTSNSKFTILTTVQGPPSTTTSAPALIQLITNTIIPRTRPFLNRLRRERQALEEARRVRDEQDRILAESERRDRDKILKIRRDNEARAKREREEAEAREREAEAMQVAQARATELKDQMRSWRCYVRQHLPAEPSAEDVKAKRAVRVQIRLPNGMGSARNVRAFPIDDSTARDVYLWAETLLLDPTDTSPGTMPPGFSHGYPPRADIPHMVLFTAYPRKAVSPDVSGWQEIKQAGGSLVMEIEGQDGDSDSD